MMKRVLTNILVIGFVVALVLPMISTAAYAQTTTSARFAAIGSYSNIYSRYYSGNVVAGILKMQVPPGDNTPPSPYDSYCIDLYKPISVGNTLVVNGDLSEATQLGSINWCAVNYILHNYDYELSYPSGHPLYNLNQNQRAAAIQAALWYFVTAPYGPYTGVSGQKYQFMSDSTNTTNFDAKPVRTQAMAIVESVPDNCDEVFNFPTSIDLIPSEQSGACNSDVALTATVKDQNDSPLSGISVQFITNLGTLSSTLGTTDSNGEVSTTLTLDDTPSTATVEAWAEGKYGTLLYDPADTKQPLTTLTLFPGSISDTSTIICEPEPEIDVEKYVSADGTDWYDADIEPGLLVPGGNVVYLKFVITNTGNVDLTDITLSDDVYDLSGCTVPATFSPGQSFDCLIGPFNAEPGENGPNKDTVTVTGSHDGTAYTDSDDAYFTPTYKKSGYVYYDDNGDGIQNNGEMGIEHVTVFLCLGCPVDQAAPCNTIGITITDSDGYYEFDGVPACSYDPEECYVVSIPEVTEDTADFNESLSQFFMVVETDKVKHNEAMGRYCIRFNLLDDEIDNSFGFMRLPRSATPVGGVIYPVDKLFLVLPIAGIMILATVMTVVLCKHVVRRRNKSKL